MATPPAAAPQQRDLHHDEEIDEAQLLAETEELLGSLDPAAFVDVCESEAAGIATYSSGSDSTSSSLDSSADGSQSAAPQVVSVTTSRKRVPKPGALRNPSRERLQSELAFLRKQVVVLETELQSTQDRKTLSATESSKSALSMAPMWERIAKRQLAACDRAVTDNKRLKSMIQLQKEIVMSMEETLYNWQHFVTPPSPPPSSMLQSYPDEVAPHKTVHFEPGDDLLFEMLVSELDATYLRVDEVICEAGLDKDGLVEHTRTTAKTLVNSDGTLRSFYELVEVEILPFDFEMVARAAKMCGQLQSQSPDCIVYRGDWDPEVVITEKHRVKYVHNGVEMYFHMLLVLKEYEFEDQEVVVWRCIFKCEDQFPDTYVQEMGWLISANLPSASPSSSSKSSSKSNSTPPPVASMSRTCVHLEAKHFTAPSAMIKAEADAMTSIVMNSYHDDLQEMNDMMENLLLKESLRQKV